VVSSFLNTGSISKGGGSSTLCPINAKTQVRIGCSLVLGIRIYDKSHEQDGASAFSEAVLSILLCILGC